MALAQGNTAKSKLLCKSFWYFLILFLCFIPLLFESFSDFLVNSYLHSLLRFICLFYFFNQLLVKFHKQKVCPDRAQCWSNYHWQTVNHQNILLLPYCIHHLKNSPQSWVYASSPESKTNLILKYALPAITENEITMYPKYSLDAYRVCVTNNATKITIKSPTASPTVSKTQDQKSDSSV